MLSKAVIYSSSVFLKSYANLQSNIFNCTFKLMLSCSKTKYKVQLVVLLLVVMAVWWSGVVEEVLCNVNLLNGPKSIDEDSAEQVGEREGLAQKLPLSHLNSQRVILGEAFHRTSAARRPKPPHPKLS